MEYKQLDKLIDEFDAMIDFVAGRGFRGILTVIVPSAYTWVDVWAKAAEIQRGFNGVRYPTKEQREQAWKRFNSLRDDASRLSKSENDSRKWKSESLKSDIMNKIHSSKPNDMFGFHAVNIEEMKSLGRILRDAGHMLSKHKRDMLGEHKQECFEAIQEMRKVHDVWWDQLKNEKSRRNSDFKARMRRNLDKNYERLRKAKNALGRARSHADELRKKIDSAWNESYRGRALGWLSEEEARIADIERSIEQIEGWIREDENKL